MSLDELRGKIDSLDARILELLNERAKCAVDIGHIKRENNQPYYVPEREREVFNRLIAKNEGPLPERAIKAIYREIMSATRALEKPISVAFLGPRDTFSHMAAIRIFGAGAEYHPMAAVPDIFTEVERERIHYGVVPVETAMGGGVSDTLDRFLTSDLKIVNEVMLHIAQNLLSNGPFEEIQKIYSKAQVFVQCRNWLKANLPHAEQIEAPSTAEAARMAASEKGAAAIASELAAETYNIGTLVAGIEDAAHNYTRFFVISRQLAKPTGHDKTSILFSLKDKPGALYELLKPLAAEGVNMTRIESRPSRKKAWEYVFFVDMLGHAADPVLKHAIETISSHCNEFKILGSYPHGDVQR
ncbi:MAG: prephenate dehydratase [Candidatus Hydrogenedentes bacterium]|nr:prephenate dehydratase [Candidatus Hydrogenedentota bacterium]